MTSEHERVDYGLRLYHEVFKLDALHFGRWKPGQEHSFDQLRQAQQHYTNTLLALIPQGVQRVLDVGCGTGATAVQILDRGQDVECVTPDAYQIKYIRTHRGNRLVLHHSRFEDFSPEAPFDLVLMSESAQYVPPDALFAAARRCLKPGGVLLLSDYFRLEAQDFYKHCHVLDAFVAEAKTQNFVLDHDEDITEDVLPTLRFGLTLYTETIRPLIEICAGFLQQKAPLLSKTVRVVLARKLKKLRWYLYDKSEQKLDAERFGRELSYRFMRFNCD